MLENNTSLFPSYVSFHLRNCDLLLVGFASPEPPSNDQYRQRSDNNTSVVHTLNCDGLGIRKAEEHDGESEPAYCYSVDQPTPFTHVEDTLIHVPSAGQHVCENGNVVSDVVDGDGRAKHRVECCRTAEIYAAQRRICNRHQNLRIERNAEARAYACPRL
jgi:hypothetical protein